MSNSVPSSAELDRWVEVAKKCEYLPENDLKVGWLAGACGGLLLECGFHRNFATMSATCCLKRVMYSQCRLRSPSVETYMDRYICFSRCVVAVSSAVGLRQFYDLQKLFQTGGELPNTSYVFMVRLLGIQRVDIQVV